MTAPSLQPESSFARGVNAPLSALGLQREELVPRLRGRAVELCTLSKGEIWIG